MSVKIYEKQNMEEGNRNCSSFMDLKFIIMSEVRKGKISTI